MNTQILEDAKEVGFDFNSSGMSLKYEANLIVKLTKFAELTKARAIAELDALKQPIDERAEFEGWTSRDIVDPLVKASNIRKDTLNNYENNLTHCEWTGWQARAQLPTNSNDAMKEEK